MKKLFLSYNNEEEANVIVFGVPIGKFSQDALKRLRETSELLEVFDIDKKQNLLENILMCDTGNLELKSFRGITEKIRNILERKKIPLVLGGNHLLSLFSVQAFENAKLIVFDAHADLKDKYEDERIREMDMCTFSGFDPKINDATWLRRLLDESKRDVILIGTRSCDETELNFMEKNKIQYFTPMNIREDLENTKKKLENMTKGCNVYISVDLDAFDPSVAPAVDQPEPDGIFFKEFRELLDSIKGNIVGIDVCCLKPIKGNEITEFLAVRVIFEILGLISRAGVA